MSDEERLAQFTIRLPQKTKEQIEEMAKRNGCSAAELARLSLEGGLSKYLGEVQYIDKEQGEAIKELLGNVFTEISKIKVELNRIGVNYNQEVRLKNLQNKFAAGQIDVSGLLREQDYIRKECKDFSPQAIQSIMDRYELISEELKNSVMAYTRISHTRNGRAAIQYARGNGKGHNGNENRNVLIGCVGMLPDEVEAFESQMAADWAQASRKNKNQVRRIVASFSEQELDPHNVDSAYTALEIAQDFLAEAYPNRKSAIFVQNDGVGQKLHVHMLVSNVDSLTHRGCTDEQTKFDYVKRRFNAAAARHITLDCGKKAEEKLTQNERRMREENEEAAETGSAAANYIWKDDLRERIRIAMQNATSEDDFLDALEDEGVVGRYGNSRRFGEYVSYELVDVPPQMADDGRKYKARSYTLGDAYGVETLREKLHEKTVEQFHLINREQASVENAGWNRPVEIVEMPPEAQKPSAENNAAKPPLQLNINIAPLKGTVGALSGTARQSADQYPPLVMTCAKMARKVQDSAESGRGQLTQGEGQQQRGKPRPMDKLQRMIREMDEADRQKEKDDLSKWLLSR